MKSLVKDEELLTLDSREVAHMIRKRHDNLVRDIETYHQYLETSKLSFQEFFIESSYKSEGNNKSYKCYEVTKKGCEFIAHKLTGQKGAQFTATYINRFHDMEKALENGSNKVMPAFKQQEIEARLKNAKVRQANILLKIAGKPEIPTSYKQILYSKASEIVTGQALLPLPETEKTYSAAYIAHELGITPNRIGRIANRHNLKTEEYGVYVWDKSPHSAKQVQAFRYNEAGRKRLTELCKRKKA